MRWWSPGAERNAPRSVWTAQFYRTTLSILINPDDHLSNQVSWRTLTINSLHRVPTLSNIWWHIKVLVSVYAWIAINNIKDQVHWAGTTVHLNRKSEISVNWFAVFAAPLLCENSYSNSNFSCQIKKFKIFAWIHFQTNTLRVQFYGHNKKTIYMQVSLFIRTINSRIEFFITEIWNFGFPT